jgi:hypothetical protein
MARPVAGFFLTRGDEHSQKKGRTMNTTYRNLRTRFTVPARFEVPVLPAAPFRGLVENDLDRLKERLLARELQTADGLEVIVRLRRAANDAAALAWLTPYPLLLLPSLFEEMAWEARRKAGRQARIRQQSRRFTVLTE